MNIFEYRNKKDLQGRSSAVSNASPTTTKSSKPASPPTSTKRSEAQAQPMSRSRGRRRVRNSRSQDRWVYTQNHLNYQPQAANGKKAESVNLEEDTEFSKNEKYRKLLDDWFPNEKIQEVYRRHPMHILYIGWPAWVLLPFLLIGLIVSLFLQIALVIVLPLLVIELGLIAWYVNDWSNDYLIVTSRRVIRLEKVTFIDSEKTEIPIEKVQEVKINSRRSPFEFFFRVGEVTFSSTSKTKIVFERLYKPERLRGEVEGMIKTFFKARTEYRKERTQDYLRNKILNTPSRDFYAEEHLHEIETIEEPGWWERLFPGQPVKDVAGKRIIWHTHPWFLIKSIFGLSFLFVLLTLGGIIGLPFLIGLKLGAFTIVIVLVYLLVLVVMMGILWYKYEDWVNDRYILAYPPFAEKILDLVKLPFGFDETINSILIRNIQDVVSDKSGIIATFLDFGTVRVSVTGGPGVDLKNIPNPEEVRDEIARRVELAKYADEDRQDRINADNMVALRDILFEDFKQRLGFQNNGDDYTSRR